MVIPIITPIFPFFSPIFIFFSQFFPFFILFCLQVTFPTSTNTTTKMTLVLSQFQSQLALLIPPCHCCICCKRLTQKIPAAIQLPGAIWPPSRFLLEPLMLKFISKQKLTRKRIKCQKIKKIMKRRKIKKIRKIMKIKMKFQFIAHQVNKDFLFLILVVFRVISIQEFLIF